MISQTGYCKKKQSLGEKSEQGQNNTIYLINNLRTIRSDYEEFITFH